jgi:histidinol-phosphatase (PHP family)
MDATCARAVELGLTAVSFTEHVDLARWVVPPELLARAGREPRVDIIERMASLADDKGRLVPPPLDVDGYVACVERCRERHPGLRIRAGAEVGEPHLFGEEVRRLVARGGFDVVLGSQHTVPFEGRLWPVDWLFGRVDAHELIRTYLAEVLRLVEGSNDFAVLAHIDYPVRHWPADAGPFDPKVIEDELRTVLRALARSGRALELNTRVPLAAAVVTWWHEEGGRALTFGSDAHAPVAVGRGLAAATAVATAAGFAPGATPVDPWRRA